MVRGTMFGASTEMLDVHEQERCCSLGLVRGNEEEL